MPSLPGGLAELPAGCTNRLRLNFKPQLNSWPGNDLSPTNIAKATVKYDIEPMLNLVRLVQTASRVDMPHHKWDYF